MNEEERLEILGELDNGSIDVEEALRRMESKEGSGSSASSDENLTRWRNWWLVALGLGIAVTAPSAWLASVGGWWWLCAAPGLAVGVMVMVFALISARSAWVHVRMKIGQGSWPRRIAISLPIPLRLTAWFLRTFGRWMPKMAGLDDTVVDELLVALDGALTSENPLYVEVGEEDGGEHIQLYLG